MAKDKVVLLDVLVSVFGMRTRIALAEKGIEYEYKEDDLQNKSPLLLEMNPVHKKIPVLIHNGKPVCESLVIVEYIDEVWNDRAPLLPSDAYERAQARFWADYVNQKIYILGRKIFLSPKGEEQEAAKELIGCFKQLEGELGDKKFLGGDTFGYLDIALVPFTSWLKVYEFYGEISIKGECPKLMDWYKRCLAEKHSVSKSLVDQDKVFGFAVEHRKRLGLD